jgi:predicted metal-dependent hydrolase
VTPHPVTHPEGHSFGLPEEAASLDGVRLPDDWRDCLEYLEGIDLFNRAYFWEAHEAWEAVWHAVGTDTTVGRYLQGLIQVAAALLKHHLGMETGVRNLLAKSARNLEPSHEWLRRRGSDRFMGVSLAEWETRVRAFVDGEVAYPFLTVPD